VSAVVSAVDQLLFEAAGEGCFAEVESLLDAGADARSALAPVEIAACNGHASIVQLLLERGADIHLNNDGALHEAVGQDRASVVAVLLDRGANIEAEDEDGREGTPLNWAATGRSAESIQTLTMLLDRGAKIDAGMTGTPLCWALANGCLEAAKVLLDRGADPRANNDEVLRYASKNGEAGSVALLLGLCKYPAGVITGARKDAMTAGHGAVVAVIDSFRQRQKLSKPPTSPKSPKPDTSNEFDVRHKDGRADSESTLHAPPRAQRGARL